MTELLLMITCLGWPLVLMHGGRKLSRVLRDRQIDREIDENMWRPL